MFCALIVSSGYSGERLLSHEQVVAEARMGALAGAGVAEPEIGQGGRFVAVSKS